MTREEAARYARCSVATIDRARASGALRSTNGGGRRIRIQRAWLDAWLLSGTLGVFALLTLTLLVLTVACLGGVIAA